MSGVEKLAQSGFLAEQPQNMDLVFEMLSQLSEEAQCGGYVG